MDSSDRSQTPPGSCSPIPDCIHLCPDFVGVCPDYSLKNAPSKRKDQGSAKITVRKVCIVTTLDKRRPAGGFPALEGEEHHDAAPLVHEHL